MKSLELLIDRFIKNGAKALFKHDSQGIYKQRFLMSGRRVYFESLNLIFKK